MLRDKVIDRVKKLMALAGNNPSQAEVAVALCKAQNLLAQHGLTMGEVERAGVKRSVRYLQAKKRTLTITWWQGCLSAIIGKSFRCVGLQDKHCLFFVGLEGDVDIATYVWELAEKALSKGASIHSAGLSCLKDLNSGELRGARNDYIRGWLKGIDQALITNIEAKGTALALVLPKEVQDISDKCGTSKQAKVMTMLSKRSRSEGYKDGSSFSYAERLEGRKDRIKR